MASSSRLASLLLPLLGVCSPVCAGDTTYWLDLRGRLDHSVNCWETRPLCSGPPFIDMDWRGRVTVVVDSPADGRYGDTDIVSLHLDANAGSFDAPRGFDFDGNWVTVTDGQVSGIWFPGFPVTALDSNAWITIEGLDAWYQAAGSYHVGSSYAEGTLTPIPEPASAVLLLAGVVACAGLARRLRPAPVASAA